MNFQFHGILILIISGLIGSGITDGSKDHGEPCSLRSQVANFFREKDSPEGCISGKGLVCVAHKCVCGDPSDIYEIPEIKPPSSVSSFIPSSVKDGATSVLGKLFGKGSTTSTPPPVTTPSDNGGRCVGRAGSPCFRTNSTCVEHAACEASGFGSISVCKCQGIYSSNTGGQCSKTASALKQVIKFGTSGVTG